MRSTSTVLSMGLATCLVIVAHGGHLPSAIRAAKAEMAFRVKEGQRGGELRLPIISISPTMNSLIAAGRPHSIHRHLYSALIEHEPNDSCPLPALAESLPRRFGDQGHRWQVTFRDGLRWPDGVSLTADDGVFTCDTAVNATDSSSRLRAYWQPMGEVDLPADGRLVHAVDSGRLAVRFETLVPWGWMAELLAAMPILPRHVLAPAAEAGAFDEPLWPHNAAVKLLTGSGAFRLEAFDSQRGIVLVRNPYDYRFGNLRPNCRKWFDNRIVYDPKRDKAAGTGHV